jgi:hypothetical protein
MKQKGRSATSMGWRERPASTPLVCLGVALLLFSGCDPAVSGEESVYTSVKSGECKSLTKIAAGSFEARGLTAEECDGVKGWRVFVVSSDARSWLEFGRDSNLWSSEEQVVYKNEFGNFPNIGAEKIEWRLDGNGNPVAVIFRIAAQDPQQTGRNLSRLFVVGFQDQAPYFCGTAKDNQAARALADKGSCAVALKRLRFAS